MLTAAQLRAARGLLDWTRTELAKAANISPETVKNIEHGTFRPQETTAAAIIRAFAAHDVHFTENEGVEIRRDEVVRYEGDEGFRRFIDDVYEAAKLPEAHAGGSKPIYIGNVNDHFFTKHMGDYLAPHIERMNAIKNLKTRILIQVYPQSLTVDELKNGSYREYRIYPQKLAGNVPFYVYGDKFAILIFDESKPPLIVVIASSVVANAYRQEFLGVWEAAKPLDFQKKHSA